MSVADAERTIQAAQVALENGRKQEAFECLKAAIAADTDHPAALAAMGMFLSVHGDPGQASQVLSRALAKAVDPGMRGKVAAALATILQEPLAARAVAAVIITRPAVLLIKRRLG
jgi:thioredoxin-like negative regulator of GroEL